MPVPAGLEVELISETRDEVISLGKTTDKGSTELSPDLEPDSYRVRLCGHEFETVEAIELTASDNRRTKTVTLVPCDDRCLLLLNLVEEPGETPLWGAVVRVTSGANPPREFNSYAGLVFATVPEGDVSVEFDGHTTWYGTRLLPVDSLVSFFATPTNVVDPITIAYRSAVTISARPTVATPDGTESPLPGSAVTVDYRGSGQFPAFAETKQLPFAATSGLSPQQTVDFEYPFPGVYVLSVAAPDSFNGLPIAAPTAPTSKSQMFSTGGSMSLPVAFQTVSTQPTTIAVATPQGQSLTQPFTLRIASPDNTVSITHQVSSTKPFTLQLPVAGELAFGIDGPAPQVDQQIPLQMSVPGQPVKVGQNTNTIELIYLHSISGTAVDERGRAVAGATIAVLDGNQNVLDIVVADEQGGFEVGVPASGAYYLCQHPEGGRVGLREQVQVNSPAPGVLVPVITGLPAPTGGESPGKGGETLTDLAAYPLLTEEITTTGAPAPAAGAPAAGGPGAGYGQTVEQAIRDVLGWRPSGDAAGFQAALAGAFALRQVEGHTEWAWQQRGYAVQADMGALTGAQASIYARATSALDQILPLLTGLTPLNPSLYPPQDLEAIRTIITAELQELVNELALEGGPRIQRIDELFNLLTGGSRKGSNFNPELVQGHLGTMGMRFGFSLANVTTLDEERVLTNFRIVVEQVLSLQDSWSSDRRLLSVQDSNTSLGTILIRLSRGLEAACESVDDLTFALDSVFVDAAQRQVIQLSFGGVPIEIPTLPLYKRSTEKLIIPAHQPPILLSDLLDWVVRACRDEGPKIVQDAGKDGVLAFAPILNELRKLIRATRAITHKNQHATLPDGMRTPRVGRALEVLAAQLDEAADLATLVQRELIPTITDVNLVVSKPVPPNVMGQWQVNVDGVNLARDCTVFLFAANRQDRPDIAPRGKPVVTPTGITATFAPQPWQDGDGNLDWQVAVINDDGTASQPVQLYRTSSAG